MAIIVAYIYIYIYILFRDYLKFTLPLSHSIVLMAWGGIEWFDGYQKANQVNYLRDTVRWGTDWLIKAHPSDNELYVQVKKKELGHNRKIKAMIESAYH